MPDLGVLGWAALAVAALVIGMSKTALPGAGTVAAASFAAVLPAKQSTGTILLLLIVGDMFALWMYRQHAEWRSLLRLAPALEGVPGIPPIGAIGRALSMVDAVGGLLGRFRR